MDINFMKEYIKGRLHELSSLDGVVLVGILWSIILGQQMVGMGRTLLISYSNPTVNIELTDSAILQLLERTEGRVSLRLD